MELRRYIEFIWNKKEDYGYSCYRVGINPVFYQYFNSDNKIQHSITVLGRSFAFTKGEFKTWKVPNIKIK